MIQEIATACLIATILIVAIKFWNVLNASKFYDSKFIWIGLILALFSWGIYYVCLFTSLQMNTTATTDYGETITVVNNSYLILVNLLTILNWFIGFTISLSLIEYILSIAIQLNPTGYIKKKKPQQN